MTEPFDDRGSSSGGSGSSPDGSGLGGSGDGGSGIGGPGDGGPAEPPAPTLGEARALAVGEKYPLFAKSFELFDEEGFRPVFSWPPLLFGALWFLYRRMYLEAAVILAVSFLLPNGGAALPVSVFLALSARWLYWKAVDRRLEKAMRLFPQEPDRAMGWLKAKGGTDPWSPAAVAAFMAFYISYSWQEIVRAAAGAS